MKRTLYYLFFSLLSVPKCLGCLNFAKQNVTFNATNFEYMLQWRKNDLTPDVSFNVQYKRYGQMDWLQLHECQNITRNYCNLTSAILNDAEDFMENQYFGRVRALSSNCSSEWVISKRLNPRDDTHLILPKLTYVQHISSITIVIPTIFVPLRRNDSQPMTVEELYKDDLFEYHLRFFDEEKNKTWQKTHKEKNFSFPGLSPNTKFNVSVYILISNERKSDIQSFVVRTLPDNSLVILIAIVIAIFAVIVGGTLLYLSCKYIKREAQKPCSLDFRKMNSFPLISAPKDKVISNYTLGISPAMSLQINAPKHELAYASQFPDSTTSQKDSILQTQSMYCPQKNNSTVDSSDHYGRVFKDLTNDNGKYLPNPNHNLCNMISHSSVPSQTNFDDCILDYDSKTFNGQDNNLCKCNVLFPIPCQEPNFVLDIFPSLPLMSSVMVSDNSGLILQLEEKDGSDLDTHIDGFTNNHGEENNFRNSLLGHEGSRHTLQYPMDNSQTDILERTFIYEKPYKIQYPSEILKEPWQKVTV